MPAPARPVPVSQRAPAPAPVPSSVVATCPGWAWRAPSLLLGFLHELLRLANDEEGGEVAAGEVLGPTVPVAVPAEVRLAHLPVRRDTGPRAVRVADRNALIEMQVGDPLRGAHKLLAPLPPRLETQAGTEHGDLRHELEADAPRVYAPRSGGCMVVHGARIEAPSRMALGVDEPATFELCS